MTQQRVLVVDDEKSIQAYLAAMLRSEGLHVDTAGEYSKAVSLLEANDYDLIFADIVLKGSRNGIDILREIRGRDITTPVIMFTGLPDMDTATQALRLGAFDYLEKPIDPERLLHVARKGLEHHRIIREKEGYRKSLEAVLNSVNDGIVSVDPEMRVIQVNKAAARLCGFGTEGVAGLSMQDLGADCSLKCMQVILEALKNGFHAESHRLECERKKRPSQVVNVFATPLLDGSDGSAGAVMFIHDQTRLATLETDSRRRRVFHGMVGKSLAMRRVYSFIEDLADVRTTVLISGESGTGKELVANALHEEGLRTGKPFVKVNCAALPEALLESELFGHVRGSFTGAIKDKPGRFAAAHGGTIFLDEIGDVSPRMQAMLLRVLQEGEFERVGDNRTIKVDVRVIAATNKDLLREMKEGRFRQDLYYRLHVADIHLPPLSERKEDLPLLVDHFIREAATSLNRNITGASNEVVEAMMRYSFPGNVRELQHMIERACVVCRKDRLTLHDMPGKIRRHCWPTEEDEERRVLLEALDSARWNKTEAARLLGISRRHLYRKLERYGIDKNSKQT
ncbi:MAG: sigma-54 dependent transcriptional regulator [Desulfatibacillaceae bacterium]